MKEKAEVVKKTILQQQESVFPTDSNYFTGFGLTRRELFAAMAMQGLLSQGIPGQHNMMDVVISESVKHADALIANLDK